MVICERNKQTSYILMGDLSQLNVSTASHRPGSSDPAPGVSLLVRQQLETTVTMVHSPDPTRCGERKREGPHFCCTWRAPLFSDAERNEKQLSHALQPGYGCSDYPVSRKTGGGESLSSLSRDLLRSPALCGVSLGVQGDSSCIR